MGYNETPKFEPSKNNPPMNNIDKQFTDLIGDAYKNYVSQQTNMYMPIWSQEEFINKIKTDDEFAKKRGVKVDVRELKLWERYEIRCKRRNFRNDWEQFYSTFGGYSDEMDSLKKSLNDDNIPTKVISFTYNNETIESYE